MTEDKRAVVLKFNGRPCMVKGEQRKHSSKFGPYTVHLVHFLDGRQPADIEVSRSKFKAAKAIRGAQADVWRRVDELIVQGMEVKRATAQAMAELAKGMLTAGQPPE